MDVSARPSGINCSIRDSWAADLIWLSVCYQNQETLREMRKSALVLSGEIFYWGRYAGSLQIVILSFIFFVDNSFGIAVF